MRRFLSLFIITAIISVTLPASVLRAQYRRAQSRAVFNAERSAQGGGGFESYKKLRLDAGEASERVRQSGRLTLPTDGGMLNLRLEPNDLRARGYSAFSVEAKGREQRLKPGPVITYRGTVEGMPGAEARFTIESNRIEGLILTPKGDFYLEPLSHHRAEADPSDYILYSSPESSSEGINASSPLLSHALNPKLSAAAGHGAFMPQAGGALRQVELATEADFEYVSKFGSAAAANNEILSIMNQVDAIYQRDVGLTFKIIHQSAWATLNDPYNATDLVGLINEFTNYWNANRTNIARDLAHMWTGRDTGNQGVSWQATVCAKPNFAYGISPFRTRDDLNPVQIYALPAHEMGHSFNATHPPDSDASCTNTIMSPIARPETKLAFCQRSRDEITAFVNANSGCLTQLTTQVVIGLSSSFYTVGEADQSGVASITVNRTGDTSVPVSVDYQTTDTSGSTPCQTNTSGVASERCDYATAAGTLRFAAGQSSKTIQIPIINDAYQEPNETFTITLRNLQGGAVFGAISSASITISSDDAQLATRNPIDDSPFFIRQQYIDFLGRVPEASGFNFWMNRLSSCPAGNTTCDRVDTSQRFFQSDEFQERGFYIYRLYDAVLGRLPKYTEFVPDVARLNGFQTPDEQRQSKDAYLQDFVDRQEFRTLYGQYLFSDARRAVDPAGFVDALCARAGVACTNRQTLIANLQSGARDPAHTLEDFILQPEIANVGTRFYDRGFITMQYFGYLRRDPEQAGFDFWQSQLIGPNAPHRGDYRFMVGGFLQSDEYRFRFALISGGP